MHILEIWAFDDAKEYDAKEYECETTHGIQNI